MENTPEKTTAEMIKEAMTLLPQPATPAEIVRWVMKQYPGTHESTIRSEITSCCVNMPSRLNFAVNERPRVADDPMLDILFRLDFGQYVSYDPKEHGRWEIAEIGGELAVHQVSEGRRDARKSASAPPTEAAPTVGDEGDASALSEGAQPAIGGKRAPALEGTQVEGGTMATAPDSHESGSRLRDLIRSNLEAVESGLGLFTDSQGNVGMDYQTPLGPVDIIATDSRGGIVLLKLEEAAGSTAGVVGNLCAQMGWAQETLAGKREVRGIVLTQSASEQLKYAVKAVPGIQLMEYEFKFEIRPVA